MDYPRMIPVSQLQAHPKNPRIAIREDVVEGIVESLKSDGFRPEYALIVRQINDAYQILSGHHRHVAAQRAGLDSIPCWVREMDDDAAYMSLVTSNTQGELTPLEIGLHALECVDKGKHGGGLSDYARAIGKSQPSISRFRLAAEVYKAIHSTWNELSENTDKHRHLFEIHAAPPATWPLLADALLKGDWSVKETHYYVEQVSRFFENGESEKFMVPESWLFFLPMEKVIEKYLATKEFAPSTVEQIWKQAQETVEMIRGFNIGDETISAIIDKYHEWLATQPWDVRVLKQHHDELRNQLESEERASAYSLGDWRDHIGKLRDGSVKLLLTDPPYGMNYQSGRKEEQDEKIKNDTLEAAVREIAECMSQCFAKLRDDAHILCFCHWSNEHEIREALEMCGLKVRGSLIWEKNNSGMGDPKTTFAPRHERIIHAVKGSPILFSRKPDVFHADKCTSENHPTEKPVSLLMELIDATTVTGDLVIDPFAGVASTLVAAKNMGRAYFGCELEEKYHEIGGLRLR